MTTYQVFVVAITSSIISAIFAALISFFITTINQRKVTKCIIIEVIEIHNQIYHKKDPEELVNEHRTQCINLQEITLIRKGLKTILEKLGGNTIPDLEGAA